MTHPAAKSMLEISRAQDEEVGDGTTSVIILAGEMMVSARPFIERDMHPTIIVSAYYQALHEGLKILKDISVPIDFNNDTGKPYKLYLRREKCAALLHRNQIRRQMAEHGCRPRNQKC